uniref:Methyltransferase n=1 Tax=Steinernema glaseri TaxID=37863 RepID=A0A1I7Z6H4_9BILA
MKDWRIYYSIMGFDHIKSRTLSREVVREMAKSITSIEFHLHYDQYTNDGWHSISPDDVVLLQLLINLDAPEKVLDVRSYCGEWSYRKLRSEHSNLLRSFKSVTMNFPTDIRLAEQRISEPRIRSAVFRGLAKRFPPASFWPNYFFSENLMRLDIFDLNVARELIDDWKNMDPWTMPYSKMFYGCGNSLKKLVGVDMRKVDSEAEAPLWEKVKSKLGRYRRYLRKYFYIIDHPVHQSRKIYAVDYYCGQGAVILIFD